MLRLFVFKKSFLILFLLILANCSVPGSAMLGPVLTGAKSGSIYQTSLSYGSGKILRKAQEVHNQKIKRIKEIKTKLHLLKTESILFASKVDKIKITDIALKVNEIELPEVFDEEPLP